MCVSTQEHAAQERAPHNAMAVLLIAYREVAVGLMVDPAERNALS